MVDIVCDGNSKTKKTFFQCLFVCRQSNVNRHSTKYEKCLFWAPPIILFSPGPIEISKLLVPVHDGHVLVKLYTWVYAAGVVPIHQNVSVLCETGSIWNW